jgi:hypothetical protein
MKRKVKTVSVGGVNMLTRKEIATLVTSRDKKWAAVCYKEKCLYSGRGRTESPLLTSKQTRSGPDLTDDEQAGSKAREQACSKARRMPFLPTFPPYCRALVELPGEV